MNIIESTVFYESWLADQTNLQSKQLSRKHEQMASNPFPFLRATFYRWLQRWRKVCGNLHGRREDALLAVGDLHVENFGIWRDSRNRLVWGINDFDEACQLPFTLDLVRLATSIILAAEAAEIEAAVDSITESLIAGYEDGIKAAGAPILLEEGTCQDLLALVSTVNEAPANFWIRTLNEDDNPEIRSKELPKGLEDVFCSALPRGATPVYRRKRRSGGLGSLGRRRFLAVLQQGDDFCIAREAKALVPSALSWLEMRPAATSLAATILQRAVRCPDPWLQVHDRWLVRQLAPDAVKIELPASRESCRLVFSPALLRAMGFETANIHLGSRSPVGLQKALERLRLDLGDGWLAAATGRMEVATRKDHLAWMKYWKRHARKSESDES